MKISLITLIFLLLPSFNIVAQVHDREYQAAVDLKNSKQLPLAEKAFSRIISKQPKHLLAMEQLAVVQSWQNKLDESVETFKHTLQLDSTYTSARVGLARVYYWQEKRVQALHEINQVLHQLPSNSSHWILKGDILMADKQFDAARAAYIKAQKLLADNTPKSLTVKISRAVPPSRWRLDAGYISDTYDAHRTDSHSSYLQLGYTFKNKATVYTRMEEYFSFDKTDVGLVVGGYYSPFQFLLLNSEIYTNKGETDFRPNHQFTLNADFLLSDHWQPLLTYRVANYDVFGSDENGDVTTITPGLRYLNSHFSVEFKHARTRNLDKTTTATNTLKLNTQIKDFSPYFFITQGEEGIPPLDVVDITIAGFGTVYRLNNKMSLRFDYSQEDRKDTYRHDSFGVGFSLFF